MMQAVPLIEDYCAAEVGQCDITVKTVGETARMTLDFDAPLNHDKQSGLKARLRQAFGDYLKGGILDVIPDRTLMIVLRIS